MAKRTPLTDEEKARISAILEENEGLVNKIASAAMTRMPADARSQYEIEDFRSAARMAMMAAARKYDPKRGTTFSQYANTRMAGAILDVIRNQNKWLSGDAVKVRASAIRVAVTDDEKLSLRAESQSVEISILATIPKKMTASQRAAIAVQQLPRLEKSARARKGRWGKINPQNFAGLGESREIAARVTGANREYVSCCKRVKAVRPDLFERILAGTLQIRQALDMLADDSTGAA